MSQINKINLNKYDELSSAIITENVNKVSYLLNNYRFSDKIFDNGLFWAIEKGNLDIIYFFFETGRVDIKRINRNEHICVLSEAIYRKNLHVVLLLINLKQADLSCISQVRDEYTGEIINYNPFEYAVRSGDTDILNALLQTGAFDKQARDLLFKINRSIEDVGTTHDEYLQNLKIKRVLDDYFPTLSTRAKRFFNF